MSPRLREPNYSIRWMAANQPAELEREMVRAFGLAVRDEARREAPVKTGTLRKSIVLDKGRVLAKAPHGLYVHEGTKPHVIRARRAPVLAFRGRDGQMVFRRSVNHPGNKPNPFLRRGMQRVHSRASSITQPILDRWLRGNAIK